MTGKKLTKNKIQSSIRVLILFLSTLIVVACTTLGYQVGGFDYSAEDIQKAIQDNIPLGISGVAPNGRGFYSKIFTQAQDKKAAIPLVMRINILGDRRPYDIEIIVRKIDPGFKKPQEAFEQGETYVGQDSLAKRILSKINDELVKRRKDRNLFDDFRAF